MPLQPDAAYASLLRGRVSTEKDIMDRTSISPKDLQHISILFPGDLYDLASLIVKADAEKSKIDSAKHPEVKKTINTTVHGLAKVYSGIADIPSNTIMENLENQGIDIEAIIQLNEKRTRANIVVQFDAAARRD